MVFGSGFLLRQRVWNEEGAGLRPSSAVWANQGDFSSDENLYCFLGPLCFKKKKKQKKPLLRGKPEDTKMRTSQGKWRVPISGVWIPLWVSKVLNYCTEFQFLIKGDSVGRPSSRVACGKQYHWWSDLGAQQGKVHMELRAPLTAVEK
jgi:hypothetical protein